MLPVDLSQTNKLKYLQLKVSIGMISKYSNNRNRGLENWKSNF